MNSYNEFCDYIEENTVDGYSMNQPENNMIHDEFFCKEFQEKLGLTHEVTECGIGCSEVEEAIYFKVKDSDVIVYIFELENLLNGNKEDLNLDNEMTYGFYVDSGDDEGLLNGDIDKIFAFDSDDFEEVLEKTKDYVNNYID